MGKWFLNSEHGDSILLKAVCGICHYMTSGTLIVHCLFHRVNYLLKKWPQEWGMSTQAQP